MGRISTGELQAFIWKDKSSRLVYSYYDMTFAPSVLE
jgi:hypothetical protein